MFVIQNAEETGVDFVIEWPVSVEVPVSGGNVRKFDFTGFFARLPETELQELHDLARKTAEEEQLGETRRPNVDAIVFFSRVLKGWKQVQNAAKEPIDFSVETLESALTGRDGMVFAIALWRAHNQMRAGAKAKN